MPRSARWELHGGIGQRRAAEEHQGQARRRVWFDGTQGARHARCGFELHTMALPVVDRKRVAAPARGDRHREDRSRIEAARKKDDRGLHALAASGAAR